MNPEIILVDDDKVVLLILEKMFKKSSPDLRLSIFSSGKETLTRLNFDPNLSGERFFLVDINLKDMSGWELIGELEKRSGNPPKVLLMSSSIYLLVSDTLEKHPNVIGFFEKPITFENIEQILELIKKD